MRMCIRSIALCAIFAATSLCAQTTIQGSVIIQGGSTGGGGGGGGGSSPGTVEVDTWAGVDNTGSAESGIALSSNINGYCSNANPPRIHFGAGTYKINTGILINALSNTCGNLWLDGSGAGSTTLTTDCVTASGGTSASPVALWYNNTSSSPVGDNLYGIRISNLKIVSTGGFACSDGIRLTQTARNVISNVAVTGFTGSTYLIGTISTSGTTVTGTGTSFLPSMAHGVLEVTNSGITTRAEVCGQSDSTHLTLCSTGWPTGNLSAGTSYALAYNGRAITCDPGPSWTQYISLHDVYLSQNKAGFFAMGSPTGGCSRISIDGKASWITYNGTPRLADDIGIWLGKGSDTIFSTAAVNNQSLCVGIESSHGDTIQGECETTDNSSPNDTPVISTCNGGTGLQACTTAVEVSSDTNGHGWANDFSGVYSYRYGNVFQFDNATGAFQAKIFGDRVSPKSLISDSYVNHFYFYGLLGCPGNGSGIPVIINTFDCNHALVGQTVN